MQLGLFLKVSFSTWCKFILASYCTCQEPGPSRQFGIKYKLFPSPMFLFLLFGYYLLLEFGICISICACIVLCGWCMSNLIIWGQRCCWFLCNSAVYSCDLVGLSDHIVAFVICISLLLWVTEMLSLGICKLHLFYYCVYKDYLLNSGRRTEVGWCSRILESRVLPKGKHDTLSLSYQLRVSR